ncbi:MAG: sodium:solute symporter family transporter [Planctomycetota bacterium]|jgi:SSS family solute:Na+ symporter
MEAMELNIADICAFVGFILFVVLFSMWMSRKEETSDDYFLAGRKLTWWLIGISLIASNISTEHFVGMAGRGYEVGMAIASYEWTAAIAMVLVALFFLPKVLRMGITTIPEYLEYRYSASARGLMAFYMMVAYIFVAIAAVLYAGGLTFKVVFGEPIKKALINCDFATAEQIAGWGDNWLLVAGVWAIGIIAGIYTVWGGLKAVVWADLFNGTGLILGGALVAFLGFLALGQRAANLEAAGNPHLTAASAQDSESDPSAETDANVDPGRNAEGDEDGNGAADPAETADAEAGPEPDAPEENAADAAAPPAVDVEIAWPKRLALGVTTFFDNAGEKLATVKPFDHNEIPWIAVFIGGLWLPQLFYWGLNQFITQRALGARSISAGQKGVLFGACLKLLIPFIIVFPGIMAFQLFGDQVGEADAAYPFMITQILEPGWRGLMLAALFGAIMSSLDSMLNSASTIFTMDLYKRHIKKDASNRSLITIGRVLTALFVIIGCLWAPWVATLGDGSVFKYIQKVWGFLSPGIVTVFLFGLFSKRTPAVAAVGAMLLGIPVYAWLLWMLPQTAFLYHMAFTFIALAAYVMLLTILLPLRDVLASSREAQSPPTDEGFVGRGLVPYGTAFLGGLLLAPPVFFLSYQVTVEMDVQEWIHFAVAGGVATIFVAVTLCLLRRPSSSVRKVVAEAKKPSAGRRAARTVFRGVFALVASAVLAVHVYLFGTWMTGALSSVRETTPFLEPCITFAEPFLKSSFEITLPGIAREREASQTLALPEEPAPEDVPEDENLAEEDLAVEPGGEEAEEEAAEEGVAVPFERETPWPNVDQEPLARAPIGGGFTRVTWKMSLFIAPLVLAGLAVVLFLVGLWLIWRQPAPGEAVMPVTDKIELKTSGVVWVWGALVIVATGVLYVLFF